MKSAPTGGRCSFVCNRKGFRVVRVAGCRGRHPLQSHCFLTDSRDEIGSRLWKITYRQIKIWMINCDLSGCLIFSSGMVFLHLLHFTPPHNCRGGFHIRPGGNITPITLFRIVCNGRIWNPPLRVGGAVLLVAVTVLIRLSGGMSRTPSPTNTLFFNW